MGLPVVIEASRRRWWGEQRKTWRRALPGAWAEVPPGRRRNYYTLALSGGDAALPEVARQALDVPRWAWRAMRPEAVAAFAGALAWMLPRPDCGPDQPFEYFDHRGIRYHLPAPSGENLACIEYPLAEEYFNRMQEEGQAEKALLLLVATLCRGHDYKPERIRRRADRRRPLYTRTEVEARAAELEGLHPAYQAHVLHWYVGLKQYVHRTYKNWLFEEPEEEEEDEAGESTSHQSNQSPNFGWWGIFQDVAEAGTFGRSVEEVLQAPFHDVCVWLVRQRVKAEEMRGANTRQPVAQEYED